MVHSSQILGNMAAIGSSQGSEKTRVAAVQLNGRLCNCWSTDIDWDKYPRVLSEVQTINKCIEV